MESKINVSLRIKPLSKTESLHEKNHLWSKISDNSLMNKRTKEVYTFDQVYGDDIRTKQIFDCEVKEIVKAALNGINQTVFVYG